MIEKTAVAPLFKAPRTSSTWNLSSRDDNRRDRSEASESRGVCRAANMSSSSSSVSMVTNIATTRAQGLNLMNGTISITPQSGFHDNTQAVRPFSPSGSDPTDASSILMSDPFVRIALPSHSPDSAVPRGSTPSFMALRTSTLISFLAAVSKESCLAL